MIRHQRWDENRFVVTRFSAAQTALKSAL